VPASAKTRSIEKNVGSDNQPQSSAEHRATDQQSSGVLDKPAATASAPENVTYDDIATRAYEYWCERGCPEGSPDIDWQRAEQELHSAIERPQDA